MINHQNNFGTNLTSGTTAGATTSPLNSIPAVDAPFYLAFDATNINGHYEVRECTSKTATNVNHAATTYNHTTSEEVRMVVPAVELDAISSACFGAYSLEKTFDYVASGCVWSGDAYASTLNASMTAGVVYIGGARIVVSLVTARAFTASKDTYIDVGTDGVIDYTEVTNNNASPALADSHIRLGIIITGASNIANVGSVNQGQEDKVLPIASSIAYAVTDSLGNLICSRDPNRKILGFRQITSNFSTSTVGSEVDVTGLSVPFIIPTGRKIKATLFFSNFVTTGTNGTMYSAINEGATNLNRAQENLTSASYRDMMGTTVTAIKTLSAGLHTLKGVVFSNASSGTITISAGGTIVPFIMVELV